MCVLLPCERRSLTHQYDVNRIRFIVRPDYFYTISCFVHAIWFATTGTIQQWLFACTVHVPRSRVLAIVHWLILSLRFLFVPGPTHRSAWQQSYSTMLKPATMVIRGRGFALLLWPMCVTSHSPLHVWPINERDSKN